ncbi:maleylpyruvate isomerase family mycothiol-dependent enzyme [Mycobacterium sp. SMC-4]|uniref:maleylpyruvate isomerase family mycothiol-dependent enzyme n=1 Tax=Mycobacterium sp. SMC-4 TaxID=2857059 RepID=UPI0021B3935F|nr:maleylpyruvate isomerase family mycothiol-dependent enzyme [Mycobacterium sp. SMC-4]UXA16732.1 maleylpyruvate isomerase family mycothiol-dependent enzyme [Mycobacterium sp. SMC-4]
MDTEAAWRHIDVQRSELAGLLEDLDTDAWRTPSLCRGWTVGHVAAHLTHSTLGAPRMLWEIARGGFRMNAVIDRMARADGGTPAEVAARLRSTVGCRRHPPGTTVFDPLTDVLVHTQDICVPLGIARVMPTEAAVAAAHHVWSRGFPFHARRRLAAKHLMATDADFAVGQGDPVQAPIRDLLMMMTGRG